MTISSMLAKLGSLSSSGSSRDVSSLRPVPCTPFCGSIGYHGIMVVVEWHRWAKRRQGLPGCGKAVREEWMRTPG